jgi:polysaccharide biosynthesis transport protein
MEFHQYWLILKRHWCPTATVFGLAATLTVISLMLQKPVYQAGGMLRFTKGNAASSLTGLLEGQIGEFDPLVAENNPISTEIEIIRAAPTIQETIDRLELKDADGNVLKRQYLLDHLRVTSVRGTDILRIDYQDPDPQLAAAVVSTLMEIYLDQHLAENRANTVAARQFIEQQLPEAEKSVQDADADLRQFKEQNHIVTLEEEASAIVEASEDLRHSIAEAEAEFANTQAQAAQFSQALGMSSETAIAAVALSQSPGVQQVLTALQEVESQLAVERVRFQDSHPTIQALETRQANLSALLDQRMQQTLNAQLENSPQNLQIGELRAELIGDFIRTEVQRYGINSQISVLANTQTAYRNRMSRIPQLEQQQRELERKLAAAQSTYSLLLERLHEIRIAENQTFGNARIIQAATVLEEPVLPRHGAHLATGLVLGIISAIATTLVLEATDKSIRTIKEIKTIFGFPILGLIPFKRIQPLPASYRSGRKLLDTVIVQEEPISLISESYRVLQTNLFALSSRQTIKAFVVTSSIPKEGKSFVSSNLAMAIAQLKHRVLLIDADMRCPSQHIIWQIANDIGLSHVLSKHHQFSTAVQSVTPHLDVLPAGMMPENPATLLDSPEMNSLLEEVSSQYNLVILDTPALNVAADVLILGHKTNGILFVARSGVVDLANAGLAKENLEQSGQHVLGLVINGAKLEQEPYTTSYTRPEVLDLNSSSYPELIASESTPNQNAA